MSQETTERKIETASGWGMLVCQLGLIGGAIALMWHFVRTVDRPGVSPALWALFAFIFCILAFVFVAKGFFTLQPNETAVLTLFGRYVGSERRSGFHWTNPFYSRRKISMRSRNFNGPTLKVNDKRGNPIEIGAVVVWRVEDAAQAVFDVEHFTDFVEVQSESALRHLANSYAYEQGEEGDATLRSDVDTVSRDLRDELMERLAKAGVVVEEARLSHLAYAPEIAGAMLRRQQAEAVIAARTKIVDGAVSMVEMALNNLQANNIVDLDDERKAAMVSNLLVVLCSESDTTPVINAGTLYS